ncbi:MAG: hypothetical protein J6W60_01745 [Treponema sp.]|nr:hypothetical protein [Treponema sp.]
MTFGKRNNFVSRVIKKPDMRIIEMEIITADTDELAAPSGYKKLLIK